MTANRAIWVGFLVVGFLLFVLFARDRVLQEMKSAQADSTAGAVGVATKIEEKSPEFRTIMGSLNTSWKQLTDSQYDQLIVLLAAKHNLDVPKGWRRDQVLRDPWGNRFEITVRHGLGTNVEVRVRSFGPDRRLDTPDDIIRPK